MSTPTPGAAPLGAHPVIRRAVDEFCHRLASDPTLARHFPGVDMDTLRRHQLHLLTATTGARPCTDPQLEAAHHGLTITITDDDFDRVLGHLNAALVAAGADDGMIRSALTAVSRLRTPIIGQFSRML